MHRPLDPRTGQPLPLKSGYEQGKGTKLPIVDEDALPEPPQDDQSQGDDSPQGESSQEEQENQENEEKPDVEIS